jgi:hypothetical protein
LTNDRRSNTQLSAVVSLGASRFEFWSVASSSLFAQETSNLHHQDFGARLSPGEDDALTPPHANCRRKSFISALVAAEDAKDCFLGQHQNTA